MKKILSLIIVLALALGMLAGCAIGQKNEPAAEATLTDALKALDALYKSENGKDSTSDFELVGKITVGETSFAVVWTTDNENITITENPDGNFDVKLPTKNDSATIYSLVATVTNSNGDSEVYSFTKNFPATTAGGSNKPNPPQSDNNGNGENGGNNSDNNTDNGEGGNNSGNNGGTVQGAPLSKVETLECGVAYFIASYGVSGDIYFNGTVESGLLKASTSTSSAVSVMLETAGDGNYYIYYMNSGVKTYIGTDLGESGTKTAQFKTSTTPDGDFVWILNADTQTIMSRDYTNRGIASRSDYGEDVMRTYSANNFGSENYTAAWFIYPGDSTDEGGNNSGNNGSQGGTTGGNNTTGGGSTEVNGTYTYTFTEKVFGSNGTQKLGDIEWTLDGNGGYWGYDPTRGQQFGSKSNPYESLTLTSESIKGIKEIRIVAQGASSYAGNIFVYVGGVQLDQPGDVDDTAKTFIFDSNTALEGEIKIEFLQSTAKALYIQSITIVCE